MRYLRYLKKQKEGLIVGYAAGLLSACIVGLVIWLVSGVFSIESRMNGCKLAMVEETKAVEVEKAFSIPERYSLINDDGDTVFVPVYQDVKKNTYDWDNLKTIDGYKYYAPNGKKACKIGIDVSKYQSEVDWKKVKDSGVQFVMVRVGYRGYGESGKIVLDEMFHKHMQGAIDAGLDVGVYFFSQAITKEEAIEEAEYVLEQIKGYDITYPVAFDSEKVETGDGRANSLSVETRTELTKAFLDTIEKEGYEPMVYANDRWFALNLDLRELADYKLWLASYREEPVFRYEVECWQHTNSASVPGVDGKVDMNIWFTE